MTSLSLSLLGGFQVISDHLPVARFATAKVRGLLAYLAVEGERPHPRAALAALFWPELPDALALRNLAQSLVRLRAALGDAADSVLDVNRLTMQWRAAETVDVTTFVRLAGSSELADLEAAANLYGGEFLAGFGFDGCDAFDEWLLLTRERLQQLALNVLERLAERYNAASRHRDVIAVAQRQLALDPWRETAYRQLMRALAATGDRAAALAAYERCCQTLLADLNLEPDAATTALAEQIRGTVTSVESLSQLATSLAVPLTPLLGREEELALLDGLLRRGTRLVTVAGPGGVGKTRLALSAATVLRDAFAHGVCWVDLVRVNVANDLAIQGMLLAGAILSSLGQRPGGQRPPLDDLRDYLCTRELLLVLDNCEHLSAAGPLAAELLTAAPGLRVLATSRERLGVYGEELIALDGLPLPGEEVTDARNSAAVQLFLARAHQQRHSFTVDAASLAGVARLCRLLEGIPLGIELAAQWVGHYSSDEIAAALRTDLTFLHARNGQLLDRHRSLRAVFAHSWSLLTDEQRRALARLSVFAGDFDRAAAEQVAEAGSAILSALVDKSLLRRSGVGRYSMHQLLRQFAAEQLAIGENTTATRDRHARYFLELVGAQEHGLSSQHTSVDILRAVLDDVRHAWQWSVNQGQWSLIVQSFYSLGTFFRYNGLTDEGERTFGAALVQLQATNRTVASEQLAGEYDALLSWLMGWQAFFLNRQTCYAVAREAAEAAMVAARRAGDALSEAFAQLRIQSQLIINSVGSGWSRAEYAAGQAGLEQAVALCRAAVATNRHGWQRIYSVESECLRFLSFTLTAQEHYSSAKVVAEEALRLAKETGDRHGAGGSLNAYASALESEGRFGEARVQREAALQTYREIGNPERESGTLHDLSRVLTCLGDYDNALTCALEAARMREALGIYHGYLYHQISWTATRKGEHALALEYGRRLLRLVEGTDAFAEAGFAWLAIGAALGGLGCWDEAEAAYQQVCLLDGGKELTQRAVAALSGCAEAALARGRQAAAAAHVAQILSFLHSHTLSSVYEPLRVALVCYRVLRAANDPQAEQVLGAAYARLMQQAAMIDEPEWHRSFLENVQAHREIIAARRLELAATKPNAQELDRPLSLPSSLAHVTRHNLPTASSALVGRSLELEQIVQQLQVPACRLLTLTGMGGVGKTSLALAAARALTEPTGRFPDGVYFVPLAGMEPSSEVEQLIATAVAAALQLPLVGTVPPATQLIHALANRALLLVLDNFEQFAAAAPLLDALLSGTQALSILVTSRQRLRLREEHLLRLDGLAVPPEDVLARASTPAEALTAYDATRLFVQRARAIGWQGTLDRASAQAVAELCRLLDGLPLALELAATWTRLLSPPQIVVEVRRSLGFLENTFADAPAHQHSMRAVFHQTWQLLSGDEQRCLSQLALFTGGFDLSAASKVGEATLPLLAALLDKSLLGRGQQRVAIEDGVSQEARFELPELIRQYAAEQLVQAGTYEAVAARHATYYTDWLADWTSALRGANQQLALRAIDGELENIRAAWQWCCAHAAEQRACAQIGRSLESLFYFYDMRSWFQEGAVVFEQAAAVLAHQGEQVAIAERAVVQVKLQARQGWFAFHLGHSDQSQALLEASLAQSRALGAEQESIFSLNYLGAVLRHLGQFEPAKRLVQEALELSRRYTDQLGTSIALNILGQLATLQGEYARATSLCQEALSIKRQIGDRWGTNYSLTSLGRVAQSTGDYAAARRWFYESLAICQAIGDQRGAAFALQNLADTAQLSGQHLEARRRYEEGLVISRAIGCRADASLTLTRLGELACTEGTYSEAARSFTEALALAWSVGSLPGVLAALLGFALIDLATGETSHAAYVLQLIANHPSSSEEQKQRAAHLLGRRASETSLTQAGGLTLETYVRARLERV
jgi:predicted ATPase/DNA-binding SARP family transcriptional activator